MTNVFSGSETVELGIQIEKNGRDFYNALAAQAKDLNAAEIFKFLAEEEERHILVFQDILQKTQRHEPPQIYADEYFAYMNALAGDYVFTQKDKGKEIAKAVTTDKQAVEMGIGFEKDSIVFYEGIKKVVPQLEHKTADSLIEEEEKHLKKLLDLRKKIR